MGLRAEGSARRPQVLRPVRQLAAHDAPDRRVRHVRLLGRPRLRRLVDPRLAGDRRERPPAPSRPGQRRPRPLHGRADAVARLRGRRPDRPASPIRATRAASPAGRRRTSARPGIADTAYFGPECEFFVFDEVSYELSPHRAHYTVDSAEGHWNSSVPGLGYTVREKGGYFPPAPHDTLHDLRSEIVLTLERLGIPCEFHHHEVATAGPVRGRSSLPAAHADGRPGDDLQVRRPQRRPRHREERHVHAQADLRRQRLGDAHPSVALEGRHAALLRQVRLCRAVAARARIPRRPPHARTRAARFLRADDQLVPPPRPRLRGACQPRLLAAEPLCSDPYSDVLGLGGRRSASSSAARTRRRTPTSPLRRC